MKPSIAFLPQAPPRRVARDPSVCYRCRHLAAELGATVAERSRWGQRRCRGAAVRVVHRPLYTPAVARIAAGKGLAVVDFDDLLFDAVDDSPGLRCGRDPREVVERNVASYRAAALAFGHATVSTQPLVEALRGIGFAGEIAVVPNGLDPAWCRIPVEPWAPGHERVLRYLSGTSSHDLDFPVAAGAIVALMRERSDVVLEVVGPLRFDEGAFPAGRVRRRPAVSYPELPALIAASWATVAPLSGGAFNRCKSGIKFLESAVFGVPCVATPIPDMARHRAGGCLLAEDEVQWITQLRGLLDDDHREVVGQRARTYVLESQLASHSAAQWRLAVGGWLAARGQVLDLL